MHLIRVNISGFFVALGNAWGLFLIIILIGYGLVAIPKLLWRAKSVRGRYEYILMHLVALDGLLMDSKF